MYWSKSCGFTMLPKMNMKIVKHENIFTMLHCMWPFNFLDVESVCVVLMPSLCQPHESTQGIHRKRSLENAWTQYASWGHLFSWIDCKCHRSGSRLQKSKYIDWDLVVGWRSLNLVDASWWCLKTFKTKLNQNCLFNANYWYRQSNVCMYSTWEIWMLIFRMDPIFML